LLAAVPAQTTSKARWANISREAVGSEDGGISGDDGASIDEDGNVTHPSTLNPVFKMPPKALEEEAHVKQV
jgi:hypothetical protein